MHQSAAIAACLALLSSAAASAGEAPAAAPAAGALALVREGAAWTPTDRLCLAADATLGYVAVEKESAALHLQPGRDGKVSRAVRLGAKTQGESDCGAGSCFDQYQRAREGAGQLAWSGRSCNTCGDWSPSYELKPSPTDLPAMQCPGGRTYLLCLSPRWKVQVELVGDRDPSGALLRVRYSASRLAGKKDALELLDGVLSKDGATYRARFNNSGYRYTLSASADPSTPAAALRVEHGKKVLLDEPCTAYSVDAAQLDARLESPARFAGSWSRGKSGARLLTARIVPGASSDLLFYLEENAGPPAFNSGALYGRMQVSGNVGVFTAPPDGGAGCKLTFTFSGKRLTVALDEKLNDCGFGQGASPAGELDRLSDEIPRSFTGRDGSEVVFSATPPEQP